MADDVYLLHETGHHPENAARLRAVYAYVQQSGLDRLLPSIASRPATDAELLAVHTPDHVRLIGDLAARGGGMIDVETLVSPQSDYVARLAVGGVLTAVDAVVEPAWEGGRGRLDAAFVLARPPGHHAMAAKAMGFCLYNSIAVAARYAQRVHGLQRILIVDWDVHHGNGTQSIFYDDPSVLFISLHQYPLWPPGWGSLDQQGTGAGTGYTINIPLPPGEGDASYALACAEIVRPAARAFRPELILVSAGQDGHSADPISDMELSAQGFADLARVAREIASDTGAYGPVLALEGGYNPRTLPYLVGAILSALGDLDLPIDDPYARSVPVSADARGIIARSRQTPLLAGS